MIVKYSKFLATPIISAVPATPIRRTFSDSLKFNQKITTSDELFGDLLQNLREARSASTREKGQGVSTK